MAVEETVSSPAVRETMERVRFSWWRGEDPMWTIGERGCTIWHCPWCGEELPDEPFSTRISPFGFDWSVPDGSK
ncbi:hypothetical protein [Parachitinimonas caeni]|uniref:Uncharacterized protein n=1 Tax=Parachitinimonas caeni TaxID=3031301 RepID=A0ABT7E137_9NEIS|nr:hypothetical protein [Parachitinimonas caeni]MDK2126034.1 hypothetical protein [Parachitinimonas caeni]